MNDNTGTTDKKLRAGFTTGSCAAAAAKAAAGMLLFGTKTERIRIMTPKGILYEPEIVDIERGDGWVSCAVVKDGGDDPDKTSGAHIAAKVSVSEDSCGASEEKAAGEGKASVVIDGGEGVGRVTQPGLDQPVGAAAINRVPRQMIEREVQEVCAAADFCGTVSVEISVPEGRKIAASTFNPRLGIVGGISIIGTSGIVEPMSTKALLDTIRVELRQKKALGGRCAAVSPGNYGVDYLKKQYGFDLDSAVKCSNFIGDTVDMAAELGFETLLLCGNAGKLVKVAGGMMNTHSREGDCRMEILGAAALRCGVPAETVLQILDCVMTDEAFRLIGTAGRLGQVSDYLMERILYYLEKRADGRIGIECVLYSGQFGELAKSKGAEKWLTLLARDPARRI